MTSPKLRYFNVIPDTDPVALRKRYLEYCKTHHPDKGGNPDTFKAIKAEYECALRFLKYCAENNTKHHHSHERQRHKLTRTQLLDDIVVLLDEVHQNPAEFTMDAIAKKLKTIGVKAGIGFIKNLIHK